MGGLKINAKGQVVAASDKVTPIPGLYAAGEVANGDFYYQQYPASGSSLSLSITFGREAGKNAANEPNHTLLR
jgi:fumarate reductase flavoprotein subunit